MLSLVSHAVALAENLGQVNHVKSGRAHQVEHKQRRGCDHEVLNYEVLNHEVACLVTGLLKLVVRQREAVSFEGMRAF